MRQVFTSPRIENVEGVAKLLVDAGIEVRVTHGRSYKGAIRGNFSYRDSERTGPQPAVWIVKSEDQPRARELLRDRGLLDSTRTPSESYLLPTMHSRDGDAPGDPRRKRAFRLKAGLLVVIAVAIALGYLGTRKAPSTPPAAARAAPAATAPAGPPLFVVDTPHALAESLLRIELEAHGDADACVSLLGRDVPADMLRRLQRTGARVAQSSACGNDASRLRLAVGEYRTDGSGIGIVGLEISGGKAPRESRRLEVERVGDTWTVLRIL